MLKKLDSILKDLGIINWDQVCTYHFKTVEGLAKRFPQLDLGDSESIDEFMDLQLSPTELPTTDTYKSATGDDNPGLDKISKIKTFDGNLRFPFLVKLMTVLMTIPSSNADSEWGFSILRKIYTDQRPSLK